MFFHLQAVSMVFFCELPLKVQVQEIKGFWSRDGAQPQGVPELRPALACQSRRPRPADAANPASPSGRRGESSPPPGPFAVHHPPPPACTLVRVPAARRLAGCHSLWKPLPRPPPAHTHPPPCDRRGLESVCGGRMLPEAAVYAAGHRAGLAYTAFYCREDGILDVSLPVRWALPGW